MHSLPLCMCGIGAGTCKSGLLCIWDLCMCGVEAGICIVCMSYFIYLLSIFVVFCCVSPHLPPSI
jgi:hypothetical protein